MDILDQLGLSEEPSVQRFSIYIPDQNKHRKTIDVKVWVEGAIRLLVGINEGATSIPASLAGCLSGDAKLEINNTTVVYSLIRDPDAFEDRFEEIIAFLSDFGRTTNQKEVMFEFSDGHAAYFLGETKYV